MKTLILFFSFLTIAMQAQVQKIMGNANDNRFGKSILHNNNYYIVGKNETKATVTKLDAIGNHLWTNETTNEAFWHDIIVNKDGNLMVIGSLGPNTGNTTDNKSLCGVINPITGNFSVLKSFNLGFREVLNRIYNNPVPSNSAFPYYVVATKTSSSGSNEDDLVVLTFNENFTFGIGRDFDNSGEDEELFRDVFLGGQNGALMAIGNHYDGVSRGNTILLSKDLVTATPRFFQQGIVFNTGFSNSNPTGGFYQVLAGATTTGSPSSAIILKANGFSSVYSYKIPSLQVINYISIGPTGNIFAIGRGMFNGVIKTVVLNLQDNTTSLSLNWAKILDLGESQFSNGYINFTFPDKLLITDSRLGNANGLGNWDGLFCAEGATLDNCMDVSVNVILEQNPITIQEGSISSSSIQGLSFTSETAMLINYDENNACGVPCNLEVFTTSMAANNCGLFTFAATVSGGTPPYTYNWDIGCNSTFEGTSNPLSYIIGIGTQPYCVTVTDASGCSKVLTNQTVIGSGDFIPPVITCPQNVNINCDENPLNTNLTGIATATDNVDPNPIITFQDATVIISECLERIVRTWKATDDCGLMSTCNQLIVVQDVIGPIVTCPPNITVSCGSDLEDTMITGNASAVDNCNQVLFESALVGNGSGTICSQDWTKEYNFKDACENKGSCTQIITTIDNIPPTITCPANITIQCEVNKDDLVITGKAISFDQCQGELMPIYIDMSGGSICKLNITRTWSVNDGCGNFSNCIQTITQIDTKAPTFTCPPNVTINGLLVEGICSAEYILITPIANDNCSSAIVSSSHPSPIFKDGTTTVTWTASDECGNSNSCQTLVTVVCKQEGDCIDFEGNYDLNNWTSLFTNPHMIIIDGSYGQVLALTDDSGGSYEYCSVGFTGDWLTRATGGCFCFDYKVDFGNAPLAAPAFAPKLTIYNATHRAFFIGNTSNPPVADDVWKNFCWPIALSSGNTLPSSPDGQWAIYTGSHSGPIMPVGPAAAAAWDALITNVQGVNIYTDYTSSPSEIVFVDNFCWGCNKEIPPQCGFMVATCEADGTINDVAVIFDSRYNSSAPTGQDWNNSSLGTNKVNAIHPAMWKVDSIGQVFGIATDDAGGRIFLTASDVYRYDNSQGPFGVGPAGPAGIYLTDFSSVNTTSQLVTTLPVSSAYPIALNVIPNTGNPSFSPNSLNYGNGIGNIAYDEKNNQLFVTNLEDGRIYRINATTGNILSIFDPFALDVAINGKVSFGEQLWGIGVLNKGGNVSVYFARSTSASTKEIWSIDLDASGEFIATSTGIPTPLLFKDTGPGIPKLQIASINGFENKITDIAFSSTGDMLLAERGSAHGSQIFEYKYISGSWIPADNFYVGGFSGRNSAGGVDYGEREKNDQVNFECDAYVWASGNYMMTNAGPLVYGVEGINSAGNLPPTSNGLTDLFIDFDGAYNTSFKGSIGDVELFHCGCPSSNNVECDSLMVMASPSPKQCFDPKIITGNPCTAEFIPVCGCDGITYPNACRATESGITTYSQGACNGQNIPKINELCCYDIDLKNNWGPDIVSLEVNMLSPGWIFNNVTLSSPYIFGDCPTLNNKFCIKQNAAGPISAGLSNNAIKICFAENSPIASLPQIVEFNWIQNTQGDSIVVCRDTLLFDCEIPSNEDTCFTVSNTSIECDPDDPYQYQLCFNVTNHSTFSINYITLEDLAPSTFTFKPFGTSKIVFPVPNPLPPGVTSSQICINVMSSVPILFKDTLCLNLGAVSSQSDTCCHDPIALCIPIEPCCDPCKQKGIVATQTQNTNGECCYDISIKNSCRYDYFTKIELEILTPGVCFGSHVLNSAFSGITLSSSMNTLTISSTVGYIPHGNLNNLLNFCLDKIDLPSQNNPLIIVNWYAGNEIACTDSIITDCIAPANNMCLMVMNQKMECDVKNNKYIYTFTIKNKTNKRFIADKLHLLVKNDPSNWLPYPTGPIIPLPSPLDSGQSVTLTTCIAGPSFPAPFSEFYFSYRLEGVNPGDCCFESVCDTISIPECDKCFCGTFSEVLTRPSQGAQSFQNSCGDTLIAVCNGPINWTLGGSFSCAGDSCIDSTLMKWVLLKPDGSVSMTGTMYAKPSYNLAIPSAAFNTSGIYSLSISAFCGSDTCKCTFPIMVECPTCCGFTEQQLCDKFNDYITPASFPSCGICFELEGLQLGSCVSLGYSIDGGPFDSPGSTSLCFNNLTPGMHQICFEMNVIDENSDVCFIKDTCINVIITCCLQGDPCEKTDIIMTTQQPANCCYNVAITNNYCDNYFKGIVIQTLTPAAISQVNALAGWTINYIDSYTATLVPPVGTQIPLGTQNVFSICNQSMTGPLQVNVAWLAPNAAGFCDTICEQNFIQSPCDSSGCLVIVQDSIDCKNKKYCFKIKNNTKPNFTVSSVHLINITPLTATLTPSVIGITPLPFGGTSGWICMDYTSSIGTNVCFQLVAHKEDVSTGTLPTTCCSDTMKHCFVVPDCDDPCGYICDNLKYAFGAENNALGPLGAGTFQTGFYTASGKPNVVDEGCNGSLQSISLFGVTKLNKMGDAAGVQQSGVIGQDIIFEKGKSYCIKFCAKFYPGIASSTANLKVSATSPFALIKNISLTSLVWQEVTLYYTPTSNQTDLIFNNVTIDPLDGPPTILIDDVRISSSIPIFNDITPPIVNCPSDTTIIGTGSPCLASYIIPQVTATDNNAVESLQCYLDGVLVLSGSTYILDNNIVHQLVCIAKDICGNKDSCVTNIMVDCDDSPCCDSISLNSQLNDALNSVFGDDCKICVYPHGGFCQELSYTIDGILFTSTNPQDTCLENLSNGSHTVCARLIARDPITGDVCYSKEICKDIIINCCPQGDPCANTDITMTDNPNDKCCYNVAITNNYCEGYFKGIVVETVAPAAISQVNALAGWTINYIDSYTATLVPPVGTQIPLGTQNAFTICNQDKTGPLEINVSWLAPNTSGGCDTICEKKFKQAPCDSSGCVFVVTDSIDCKNKKYCFKIKNNTKPNFTVSSVHVINITPSAATVTPAIIGIPPLAFGATSDWICVDYTAPIGTNVCFQLVAHKENVSTGTLPTTCCTDTTKHCFVVPDCDTSTTCPSCPAGTTQGVNLVNNGDFELGNVGFTSGYTLAGLNINNGQYDIRSSNFIGNTAWAEIDHTNGTVGGKFLVANGPRPTTPVWSNTVNVIAGNTYNFCAWVNNLIKPTAPNNGPPIVEVKINGTIVLVPATTINNVPNQWVIITGSWVSTITGPITIEIVNTQTAQDADLGVDDISFVECSNCAVGNPCPTTNITVSNDPAVGDTCCYDVTIENGFCANYFKGIKIVLTAPSTVSQITAASGWYINAISADSAEVFPIGGLVPLDTLKAFTICPNSTTNSFDFTMTWLVPNASGGYDEVCPQTIQRSCAMDNQCVQIVEDSIDCINNKHCFKVKNTSKPGFTITSIDLIGISPSGAVLQPNPQGIPPLVPGATSDWICYTYSNVQSGDTVCYYVVAHKENVANNEPPTTCCADTIKHCFVVPKKPCDPIGGNCCNISQDSLNKLINLVKVATNNNDCNVCVNYKLDSCTYLKVDFGNGIMQTYNPGSKDTICQIINSTGIFNGTVKLKMYRLKPNGDTCLVANKNITYSIDCGNPTGGCCNITQANLNSQLNTLMNSITNNDCEACIATSIDTCAMISIDWGDGKDTIITNLTNKTICHNYGNDGSYTISVTLSKLDAANNKCIEATATKLIITENCIQDSLCDVEKITVFNALSPNGDGLNDVLNIINSPNCGKIDVSIYNRWGQLVWSQADYNNTWNGDSNLNGPLPDGTYYLILSLPDIKNSNIKPIQTFIDLRRD